MKKLILAFSLSLLSTAGFSQVTIAMEESNGIYKIPCSVNGLKMKFIFDTGASAVSLSQSMAEYMFDNDYLKETDITGTAKTQIADGSVVDVVTVNLRDFEVAGFHLANVLATIKSGQDVPLLMGQSAIEKLGRISISGNKLIIHKPKVKLTPEEITQLRKSIQAGFKAQEWEKVVEKSAQLKDATTFNQWDYYYYVYALDIIWVQEHATLNKELSKRLLSLCDDWEASGINSSDKVYAFLNERKAHYITSLVPWDADNQTTYRANNEAIKYYKKALSKCTQTERSGILSSISDCYYVMNLNDSAEQYQKQAIEAHYKDINKTIADALEGRINEPYKLGLMYWQLALIKEEQNDFSDRNFYIKLSAKCGFPEAIEFCFENNINYTK